VHDDDQKFDDFLRSAAKDYKSSSAPHAGEMWSAIEPDVAKAIGKKGGSFAALRMTAWAGIGIAATLMLGIGIGRWTSRQQSQQVAAVPPAVSAPVDSNTSVSHTRATAIEHLSDAEVFLTSVRADLASGRSDADRTGRSRELLVRTRILLGNPNTAPEVRRLLEDLELLLAEISALPAARSSMDQKLLNESMREGNVIPRIRATLPPQAGS
jgi:hypothetical protein